MHVRLFATTGSELASAEKIRPRPHSRLPLIATAGNFKVTGHAPHISIYIPTTCSNLIKVKISIGH
jgi:hypothetical protein